MIPYEPDEIRARILRLLAAGHRKRAAELERAANAAMTAASSPSTTGVPTYCEAGEMTEHPDLAELNMQLDAYYDGPQERNA
ncbi:hypothetical protein ACFYPT_41490 [Streptomyces sp. NPDC005529]|uniref:hypothetical protein n=1 Tax=unclassified Streptomyces TaxID=2593676 RepID=UPI0033B06E8F